MQREEDVAASTAIIEQNSWRLSSWFYYFNPLNWFWSSAASTSNNVEERTLSAKKPKHYPVQRNAFIMKVNSIISEFNNGLVDLDNTKARLGKSIITHYHQASHQDKFELVRKCVQEQRNELKAGDFEDNLSPLKAALARWTRSLERQLLPYEFAHRVKSLIQLRQINSRHRPFVPGMMGLVGRPRSLFEALQTPPRATTGIVSTLHILGIGINDKTLVARLVELTQLPQFAELSTLNKLKSVSVATADLAFALTTDAQKIFIQVMMQVCFAEVKQVWADFKVTGELAPVEKVLNLLGECKQAFLKNDDSHDKQLAEWVDLLAPAVELNEFSQVVLMAFRQAKRAQNPEHAITVATLTALYQHEPTAALAPEQRIEILLREANQYSDVVTADCMNEFLEQTLLPELEKSFETRNATQNANEYKRLEKQLGRFAKKWMPIFFAKTGLTFALWRNEVFCRCHSCYQYPFTAETFSDIMQAFAALPGDAWQDEKVIKAYELYFGFFVEKCELAEIEAIWHQAITHIPQAQRFSPIETMLARPRHGDEPKRRLLGPLYQCYHALLQLQDCVSSHLDNKVNLALQVRFAFVLISLASCQDRQTFAERIQAYIADIDSLSRQSWKKTSIALIADYRQALVNLQMQFNTHPEKMMRELPRFVRAVVNQPIQQSQQLVYAELLQILDLLQMLSSQQLDAAAMTYVLNECRHFFPDANKTVEKAKMTSPIVPSQSLGEVGQACLQRLALYLSIERFWLQQPDNQATQSNPQSFIYVVRLMHQLAFEIYERRKMAPTLPVPPSALGQAYADLHRLARFIRAINDYHNIGRLDISTLKQMQAMQSFDPLQQHEHVIALLLENDDSAQQLFYAFYLKGVSLINPMNVDDHLPDFHQQCLHLLNAFKRRSSNAVATGEPLVASLGGLMRCQQHTIVQAAARRALDSLTAPVRQDPARAHLQCVNTLPELIESVNQFVNRIIVPFDIPAKHNQAVLAFVARLYVFEQALLGEEAEAQKTMHSANHSGAVGLLAELVPADRGKMQKVFGDIVAREDFAVSLRDDQDHQPINWTAFMTTVLTRFIEHHQALALARASAPATPIGRLLDDESMAAAANHAADEELVIDDDNAIVVTGQGGEVRKQLQF